ncbi:immunoglobulin superfamily DCC subclass member 4 isoform X1 [Lampetra planeri]
MAGSARAGGSGFVAVDLRPKPSKWLPLALLAVTGLCTACWCEELSCSPGPLELVVSPSQAAVLDCHLTGESLGATGPSSGRAAAAAVGNVTWTHNGAPLAADSQAALVLPNGSLALPPGNEGLDGGNYACEMLTPYGTLVSRPIRLRYAVLSKFTQHPVPQKVPEGSVARLQCRIEGSPPPVIAWERDHTALPPDSRFTALPNGVLQIAKVELADEGSYRCVASNSAKKRYSQEAALEVNSGEKNESQDPAIVVRPQNVTVVAGRSAVLECLATGTPDPIVSWSRLDGMPISPDAAVLGRFNLLFVRVRAVHAGAYVCRVNKLGSRQFTTATAQLAVLVPPAITQPPETLSKARAGTARFICKVEGEPPPVIRWLKNGRRILSNGRVRIQNNHNLVINQLAVEDAGPYQCVAENGVGSACASARLTVTIREGLPGPPRNLRATVQSSVALVIGWERPEQHSGEIIGFSIHYQKAVGINNEEYQFAVNNDTAEFLLKDLEPDTNYTIYMVAYSQRGASQTSQLLTVSTPEDVPSAAPQLSLSSAGGTDIRVSWLPLERAESRGRVLGYRVEYSAQREDTVHAVEVPGGETQVTLSGLQPSRAYRVRISAATGSGSGEPSPWTLHRTTPHSNRTAQPPVLQLTVESNRTALQIFWHSPANHFQIRGYQLYCRQAPAAQELADELEDPGDEPPIDGTDWLIGPISLRRRATHYTISGLKPGVLYEVRLVVHAKHDNAHVVTWRGRTPDPPSRPPASDPGVLPELPELPSSPMPPTHLLAQGNGSSAVRLWWRKPAFSNVEIVGYTVRYAPSPAPTNASAFSYIPCAEEGLLVQGLKPFTRYQFSVQSHGHNSNGRFGDTVEEATPPDRPGTPPMDVTLSAVDMRSVRVAWEPPLEPNGPVSEYVLIYSSNASLPREMWTAIRRAGDALSADIVGLESGTLYFFSVGAKTPVGPGPFSTALSVHTLVEPQTTGLPLLLNVHSLTGMLVGVCIAFACVSLCVAVLLCRSKHGRASRPGDCCLPGAPGDPTASASGNGPQMRNGRPLDSHELETLMCCQEAAGPDGTARPGRDVADAAATTASSYSPSPSARDPERQQLVPNGTAVSARNKVGNGSTNHAATCVTSFADETATCDVFLSPNSTALTDLSLDSSTDGEVLSNGGQTNQSDSGSFAAADEGGPATDAEPAGKSPASSDKGLADSPEQPAPSQQQQQQPHLRGAPCDGAEDPDDVNKDVEDPAAPCQSPHHASSTSPAGQP